MKFRRGQCTKLKNQVFCIKNTGVCIWSENAWLFRFCYVQILQTPKRSLETCLRSRVTKWVSLFFDSSTGKKKKKYSEGILTHRAHNGVSKYIVFDSASHKFSEFDRSCFFLFYELVNSRNCTLQPATMRNAFRNASKE